MEGTFWVWASILGVALAITMLMWATLRIRDWYRGDAGHADDPAMFLTALRESTRRGDVSDDEYRSIQSRLRGPLTGSAPAGEDRGGLGGHEAHEGPDSGEGGPPPEADDGSPAAG